MAKTADSLVLLAFEQDDVSHLIAAADLYEGVLNGTSLVLGSLKRAEVENNVGSVHCLIAQRSLDTAIAAVHLDKAEGFLKSALTARSRKVAPLDWAVTSTNLVIVDMARYGQTRQGVYLLAANLRLDDATEEFQRQQHTASLQWAHSVREHLELLRKPPQA
ncbi:hypothetical protein [Devosia sp.]|uniref:hypothetical protein n=1 Tax=Devosia sp. TaxID=1871048 RepID=UPI0032631FB1